MGPNSDSTLARVSMALGFYSTEELAPTPRRDTCGLGREPLGIQRNQEQGKAQAKADCGHRVNSDPQLGITATPRVGPS